jgi:hypothetical protein
MKDANSLARLGFIALLIVLLQTCGEQGQQASNTSVAPIAEGEYLEPELRAKVESLKLAVSNAATSQSNVAGRARVLYDWGNAFSLHVGQIPVELPLTTSLGMNLGVAAHEGRNVYQFMDTYIHELTLRESDANAVGSLVASPTGPFRADSYVTFEQIYTVGSLPVQEGGGFLVASHVLSAYQQSQETDPEADNYVSIKSSNPQASFRDDSHLVVGMHGGFRAPQPEHVFRLQGTDLQPGDTVTIIYGDTSAGSAGYRVQNFSNDKAAFPLYIDLDGSNRFITLPIQAIKISGTDVAGVHGFVPSIVAVGEEFELAIRFQDRFANLAEPPFPELEILLNGEPFRTLEMVSEGIVVLEDLTLDAPGVYRFSFSTEEFTGTANPILVQNNPDQRIYWGDTHGHSGMAEGLGSADGFMRFARDEARLDYVTHSEHDIWLDDSEWKILSENIIKYREPGVFIPFLGYEWSQSTRLGGHHNVLFRTPENRERIARQEYPTLTRLYHGLRTKHDPDDVVIIPHAHQAGEYRTSDHEMEHLVEIMSGHGTFEWFGRMYLKHGHQVGFIAASDDHIGHPGYSAPRGGSIAQRGGLGALFATEKTNDALFDAMKALRTYATTGDRIILTMDVNGTTMGGRAEYSEKRLIKGRVIATAPIDTITLIKNDVEIWTRNYMPAVTDSEGPTNFQLSFYSDSDPYHHRDNPRGWRVWSGTLEVKQGTLLSVSATDHVNPGVHNLSVDEDNKNLVHFTTMTRGDASSINLLLDSIGDDTEIEVKLEQTRETGGAPQLLRQHGRPPAWDLEFSLAAMEDNSIEQSTVFQAWTDKITLRRIAEEGVMETEFEITDNDSPLQGDYYYLRVKQMNDAYAWSSPVWVGGFPAQ